MSWTRSDKLREDAWLSGWQGPSFKHDTPDYRPSEERKEEVSTPAPQGRVRKVRARLRQLLKR